MTPRLTGLVLAAALAVAACSSGDDADDPSTTATSDAAPTASAAPSASPPTSADSADPADPPASPAPTVGPGSFEPAAFEVAPGTEQITVTDAEPERPLTVFDDGGVEVASGTVDDFGALVFRGLAGGVTYTVGDGTERSAAVTTLDRDDHPAEAFYAEQRLPTEGLGYVTTRDGTTLSASVWLPGPPDDGPYPTVVEYSGYDPSDPEADGFATLFTALGYGYVGVNMRGTGCSGGSFDYFEYTQNLDGYDAVEVVAAQPWVANEQVGMVGLSYPGISQLFVAQTRPPSLAAISPLSVIADTALSTLYPGGILNTGFAVPWAEDLVAQARPEGSAWAADRIAGGDDLCAENQRVRLQSPDPLARIDANEFWTDDVAAELAPRLFVDRITVPTLLAGTWQDEQTGGHFPTMLDRFTGTDHFYASMTNGLHIDAIGPAVLPRLIEFLDLYVAERTPSLAVARLVAPIAGAALFGTSELTLPTEDRFAGLTHAEALAAFESEPPIRVLFEQGAADGQVPRSPVPRFEAAFEAWPIPSAEPRRWFLNGATGALGEAPLEVDPPSSYLALPDAVPPTWYGESSGDIWSVDVTYDWREGGAGTFLAFATAPLDAEAVVAGSGSVDLWLQSNLGDTDVEVTVSELRPDGQELYVQSGWLRASRRALDEDESTELRPVHTHLESDAAPLPEAVFDLVRVELFPFAHVFREGSRIRLTIDAPGGNRPVWEFDTIAGGEQVTIAHDDLFPSSIVLPIVDSVDAPDAYPPCDALRGQPCRPSTAP